MKRRQKRARRATGASRVTRGGQVVGLEFLEARHLLAGLEPGDANEDYYVSAADLIQAFKAGKYETVQLASWGEGDWNTDGRFNSGDLVAMFSAGRYERGPYQPEAGPEVNELEPLSTNAGAQASFAYDADTGDIVLSAQPGFTTIHVRSQAGLFLFSDQTQWGGLLQPPFDIATSHDLFLFRTQGLQTAELKAALPPGLNSTQLLNDLLVDGSVVSGGDLGDVFLACSCLPAGSSAVQGQVFRDFNADGVHDAGEPFVNGVGVSLRYGDSVLSLATQSIDLNDDGSIDSQTEVGVYRWTNLPAGDYTVSVHGAEWAPSVGNAQQMLTLAEGASVVAADLGATYVPRLHAGDANQDFSYDYADLIMAFQAGKYETGQPATWAEGDWNGAPGGGVGNPPAGNGLFDWNDLFPVLQQPMGPYSPDFVVAANTRTPLSTDLAASTQLNYAAETGILTLLNAAEPLTTLHLYSRSGLFAGALRETIPAEMRIVNEHNVFILLPWGMLAGRTTLGTLLPPGLTSDALLADLEIDGARFGGGGLGAVALDTSHLAAPLEPGDANEDYYVGAADLIQAFKAGKYETDQLASWGEGDWNTDGRFNSGDFVVMFMTGLYEMGPYQPDAGPEVNELEPLSTNTGAHASLAYNADTGDIVLSAQPGFTTIHVRSQAGLFQFRGPWIDLVLPPFDIATSHDLFLLKTQGLQTAEFKAALPPGLNSTQLLNDLLVDGSLVSGGDLGDVFLACNCLPAGSSSVQGQVFRDFNADGVRDAGEPFVDGVGVILRYGDSVLSLATQSIDLNDDGSIDSQTEVGVYRRTNLPAGDYTVYVNGVEWAPSVGNAQQMLTLAEGASVVAAELGATYFPRLHAGDANQDFSYDYADLIMAFQAGKYQTGQPATWAEGDWNGAPGGGVGNPPAGNGFFDWNDLFPVLQQPMGPYSPDFVVAANTRTTLTTDQTASTKLIYAPSTGQLGLFNPSTPLSALHLYSRSGSFQGSLAPNISGDLRVVDAHNVFILTPWGVPGSQITLGTLLPAGLTYDAILADVEIDGARMGGGGLGAVALHDPATLSSITGQVFHDANSNGQRDLGESLLNGIQIHLSTGRTASQVIATAPYDLNQDGQIDVDTESGVYHFDGLLPGFYTIRFNNPPPNDLIYTTPGTLAINVTASMNLVGNNFGITQRDAADFNRDGQVNTLDLDLLLQAIRSHKSSSSEFNVNKRGRVDFADLEWTIITHLHTTFGDANLDGVFDSQDLVQVMAAGEYEDKIANNSGWADGDWNGNGDFDAFDLVVAFQYGGYQSDFLPAVSASALAQTVNDNSATQEVAATTADLALAALAERPTDRASRRASENDSSDDAKPSWSPVALDVTFARARCWLAMALLLIVSGIIGSPDAWGQQVEFRYDELTGNLSVESPVPLTTLELVAQDPIFTGPRPTLLDNDFDVYTPNKLFRLDPVGFQQGDFGSVFAAGLTAEYLASELCPRGSRLPAGPMPVAGILDANNVLVPLTGCDPLRPAEMTLLYDAPTGNVSVRITPQLATPLLTSLVIDSAANVFTGTKPDVLDSSFDVLKPNRVFHLDVNGFRDLDFGPIAKPNLTQSEFRQGLCVAGSLVGGGEAPIAQLSAETSEFLPVCNVTSTTGTVGGVVEPPPPPSGPTRFIYDPNSGNLRLDSGGRLVTSLEILSASGLFVGTPAPGLIVPPFDVFGPNKLFILRTEGILSPDLGPVLPAGLTVDYLTADLTVSGSVSPSGGLGSVGFVIFLPEPDGWWLTVSGLLIPLWRMRRLRSAACDT